MELQAGKIAALGRGGPAAAATTSSASSPPRIADEVLALVNAVPNVVGAIIDVQSTVDPIAVRTPFNLTTTPTHHLTR